MNVQKWEYKIISSNLININIMQDKLNELGKEGWELVAADPGGGYILKKPIINISKNTENLNNNASNIKDIISLYQ